MSDGLTHGVLLREMLVESQSDVSSNNKKEKKVKAVIQQHTIV